MTSADDWISGLPSELAAQRALLHRLLAAVTVGQQWDWLELGCSVASWSNGRTASAWVQAVAMFGPSAWACSSIATASRTCSGVMATLTA